MQLFFGGEAYMKVILNGARGKMGSEVWKMLEEGRRGTEIAAGIDPTADGSDARILKNFSIIKEMRTSSSIFPIMSARKR